MEFKIDLYNMIDEFFVALPAPKARKKELTAYIKEQCENDELVSATECCDILGLQRRHNRAVIRDILRKNGL